MTDMDTGKKSDQPQESPKLEGEPQTARGKDPEKNTVEQEEGPALQEKESGGPVTSGSEAERLTAESEGAGEPEAEGASPRVPKRGNFP